MTNAKPATLSTRTLGAGVFMHRVLFLLVALVGCSTPPPAPPLGSTEDLGPGPVAETSPDLPGVTVTLLEAGSPPLRRLRYQPVMGREEVLRVTETPDIRHSGTDGTKRHGTEPTEHLVRLTPRGRRDGYLVRYDVTLEMTDERPPDGEAAAWDALHKGTAEGHASDRGLSKDLNPRLARIPDADAAAAVRMTWIGVEGLRVPFPEEDVGIGARWAVVDRFSHYGAESERTRTWTLVALEGDAGRVSYIEEHTITDPEMRVRRMPKGTRATLDSFEYAGQGELDFDLRWFTATGQEHGELHSRYHAEIPGTVRYDYRTDGTSDVRWERGGTSEP